MKKRIIEVSANYPKNIGQYGVGDTVGNTVQGFDFKVIKIDGDKVTVKYKNDKVESYYKYNFYKPQSNTAKSTAKTESTLTSTIKRLVKEEIKKATVMTFDNLDKKLASKLQKLFKYYILDTEYKIINPAKFWSDSDIMRFLDRIAIEEYQSNTFSDGPHPSEDNSEFEYIAEELFGDDRIDNLIDRLLNSKVIQRK